MKQYCEKFVLLLTIVLLSGGACRKPYSPPAINANRNFLVVDGFVNTGAGGITTIKLSRTWNLADTLISKPESGASVSIEQENGGTFFLQHKGNGVYESNPLTLATNRRYRIVITGGGGVKYQSEYVQAKPAPPIDSISWEQPDDLKIFATAHDASGATKYYRWDFVETWEYHSFYDGWLGQKNGRIFYRDTAQKNEVYICYTTEESHDIILGSSISLSEDVIAKQPITVIPQNSVKGEQRYSMLLRQYALTENAYQYWLQLQKTSQGLGTLFDPQPSQLAGNIVNLANPDEPVIGYLSAGTVSEKRIFIHKRVLHDWVALSPGEACNIQFTSQDPNDPLRWPWPDTSFSPFYFITGGGLAVIKTSCVDCMRRGGTNQQPSFW
ncbi:MAG: DUF4249 domain-containing protein [Gemmatimonadaceae bacterium]|nr:DUF4249 domain-containing protein [Chitinophagaceae bacterium]